jgi:hypothetical protein
MSAAFIGVKEVAMSDSFVSCPRLGNAFCYLSSFPGGSAHGPTG